jgi:hypothetical protein
MPAVLAEEDVADVLMMSEVITLLPVLTEPASA